MAKELTDYQWAKQFSPPALMVMKMSVVWEVPNEDEEKVASRFLKYWGDVKAYLKEQLELNNGKKPFLSDYRVPFEPSKDTADDLSMDFFNILWSMDTYFFNTRRYQEVVSFCTDVLELFDFQPDEKGEWISAIGDAYWRIDPEKGDKYFKEYFKKLHDEHGADARDDVVMGLYAQNLISDKRIADAREAMKGYEDTTNETLDDAFCRLADYDEKPEFSAPLTKEQFWQTLTYVIRHNPVDGPELIMQNKHLPLAIPFDKENGKQVFAEGNNMRLAACYTSLTPRTGRCMLNFEALVLKEIIIEDLFESAKEKGLDGLLFDCTTFKNDQVVAYEWSDFEKNK